MAVLLSKLNKILLLFCAVFLISNNCALAWESSFNDNFFNVLSKPKKTPEMIAAKEELKKRKIPSSVEAFIKHVKKNDVEVLKLFVDAGFKVNTDFFGDYPIYYAAKYDSLEAAQFLLENGAKPNVGFNPPLVEAIKRKNPKMAHILMEHGQRVNIDDFMSGETILFTALKNKQIEIARDMIEHGARIDSMSRAYIERKKLYSALGLNTDFERVN